MPGVSCHIMSDLSRALSRGLPVVSTRGHRAPAALLGPMRCRAMAESDDERGTLDGLKLIYEASGRPVPSIRVTPWLSGIIAHHRCRYVDHAC